MNNLHWNNRSSQLTIPTGATTPLALSCQMKQMRAALSSTSSALSQASFRRKKVGSSYLYIWNFPYLVNH